MGKGKLGNSDSCSRDRAAARGKALRSGVPIDVGNGIREKPSGARGSE